MKLSDLLKLKPIIEAIDQGKQIELDNYSTVYTTSLIVDDSINLDAADFFRLRVKPEPIEWYEVRFFNHINREYTHDIVIRFESIEQAKRNLPEIMFDQIVKVREVLDD